MSDNETYEGWSNRETWAVALHINNDQGWQESVHEALREYLTTDDAKDPERTPQGLAISAGEVIRENVEEALDNLSDPEFRSEALIMAAREFGSLWRVNWDELGASFLEDIED